MKKFYPMAILLKFEGYPPAVIASLLIHACLISFLLGRNIGPADYLDIKDPVYVTASAVRENPQRLRRLERLERQRLADEKAERDRQARARREKAEKEEREKKRKEEAERLNRQEQARKKTAEEEAEKERQRVAQEEEKAKEARRQEQERLAREQAQRDAAQQARAEQIASENLLVAEYSAKIRQVVTQNWQIPPSARNGMRAVVGLQLVPTGEVVGVNIVQSSGNDAFDRSAMQAVERVGRFPELQELDNAVFERNFRTFTLLFQPEDLLR